MSLRRRLVFALLIVISVLALSVLGYLALGGSHVSILEAVYMAVITLAGVGYAKIIETTDPAMRVFNMLVVVIGVALTVYVVSVITAFLVEGEIRNIFWRRRMERRIQELKDHYIVCGVGETGSYALEELIKTETPFVAIDLDEENLKKVRQQTGERELLWLVGDAADAAVLDQAGIAQARALIAAVPSDKDNLVITVMARQQNPNVRIVARCRDLKFAERLVKAGANSTVSPDHIGGLRMASEALRPHVVSFLDLMLKERSRTLRVEEIDVPKGGAWVGLSMSDVDLRGRYRLLPLALKEPSAGHELNVVFDPPDTHHLTAGSVLVVMGDVQQVHRAQKDAQHKRISAMSGLSS